MTCTAGTSQIHLICWTCPCVELYAYVHVQYVVPHKVISTDSFSCGERTSRSMSLVTTEWLHPRKRPHVQYYISAVHHYLGTHGSPRKYGEVGVHSSVEKKVIMPYCRVRAVFSAVSRWHGRGTSIISLMVSQLLAAVFIQGARVNIVAYVTVQGWRCAAAR